MGARPESRIICKTKIKIVYRSLYFSELFIYYNKQSKWYSRQKNLCQIQRGKRESHCKKSELLMLGKYLNLEVKMLKFEIHNVIVTQLVDGESLHEDALDLVKAY
jgi:hypothetical protein